MTVMNCVVHTLEDLLCMILKGVWLDGALFMVQFTAVTSCNLIVRVAERTRVCVCAFLNCFCKVCITFLQMKISFCIIKNAFKQEQMGFRKSTNDLLHFTTAKY